MKGFGSWCALALVVSAQAQQPAVTELGAMPLAASMPRVEFAFEARVTLSHVQLSEASSVQIRFT